MEKTLPCNGFNYDLLREAGLNDTKENGVWVMGGEADRLSIRYCCWCDWGRQLSESVNSTSRSNQKTPCRVIETELKRAESWAWNIRAAREKIDRAERSRPDFMPRDGRSPDIFSLRATEVCEMAYGMGRRNNCAQHHLRKALAVAEWDREVPSSGLDK